MRMRGGDEDLQGRREGDGIEIADVIELLETEIRHPGSAFTVGCLRTLYRQLVEKRIGISAEESLLDGQEESSRSLVGAREGVDKHGCSRVDEDISEKLIFIKEVIYVVLERFRMFPVPSVERPKGDRIGGGVYTEIPGTGDWNSSSNAISDMLSPVFESQDDFRSVGG
jgi:hypothetical protein